MGAYVCAGSSGIDVAENTVKILVLGFSGAGKTFVVYSWALGVKNMVKTLPTDAAMFNVEKVQAPLSAVSMYMWDISGKMVQRRRSYFLGTQGIHNVFIFIFINAKMGRYLSSSCINS